MGHQRRAPDGAAGQRGRAGGRGRESAGRVDAGVLWAAGGADEVGHGDGGAAVVLQYGKGDGVRGLGWEED